MFSCLQRRSDPTMRLILGIAMLFAALVSLVSALHPVVIIPALMSTPIQLKLDRTHSDYFWCEKKSDWYTAWMDKTAFIPGREECLYSDFKLNFDRDTRLSSPPEGVQSRFVGEFGTVETVEYLCPKNECPIWSFLIGNLTEAGYTRNKDIVAAPYDWRYGPNQWGGSFDATRALIEQTYAANGNSTVILMSLSMGGPYTSLFLSLQPQAWKDRYIRFWYSLSGVFSGSTMAILATLSKEPVPFFISATKIRELARSFPSTLWLFPREEGFEPDRVWVSTPAANYTTKTLSKMLWDLKLEDPALILDTVTPFNPTVAPGVEVHCSFGYNVNTTTLLAYKDAAAETKPIMEMANGDGVVLLESLSVCAHWATQQNQPVHLHTYDGMYHAYEIFLDVPMADVVRACVTA